MATFVLLTNCACLHMFSDMISEFWPPEVLTDCLFCSVVTWVQQSVVVTICDLLLLCQWNADFVFQSSKFKGLFSPMKNLLGEVTRLNDQELFQWWTCALCFGNVSASEGIPVWIIIHFETL